MFGEMFDQARLKEAGEIWMKGLHEMHEAAGTTAKVRSKEVADFWKAFFSIKSMEDVKKLQMHVAQSTEKSVSDTSKTMNDFKSLVENTMKPLKPE